MPVQVKICGLQDVEVLKSIVNLPIDYIGLVFAPSKRQVTPERAGEMMRWMRSSGNRGKLLPNGQDSGGEAAFSFPAFAGVFVDPTQEQLRDTMTKAPLDVIQLHGQESPEFCRRVKETFAVKVFKVVSFPKACGSNDTSADSANKEKDSVSSLLDPFRHCIDAVLLDTHDPLTGGGSGKAFAWNRIPAYLNWAHENGLQLFVAGGLHDGNVDVLVRDYLPDGVDVSSGVETEGKKDIEKIRRFVERVKAND